MKKNKGITLIALVITIIVILILSGVTISLVLNGGILEQAQQATESSKREAAREKAVLAIGEARIIAAQESKTLTLENLGEYIAKTGKATYSDGKIKVDGYEFDVDNQFRVTGDGKKADGSPDSIAALVNSGTIKVGDYVGYTPDTAGTYTILAANSGMEDDQIISADTTLKWRVYDIKNGQIRVISDNTTSNGVMIKGYNGYNNGVYLLNDLCKTLYSKNGVGTARSMNIEDITSNINGFNDTMIKNTGDNSNYGTSYNFTDNLYYPEILKQEEKQSVDGSNGTLKQSEQTALINTQIAPAEADNSLELTNTWWWWQTFNDDSILPTDVYNLIFGDGCDLYYWLSSRCVHAESSAAFKVYYVNYFRDVYGMTLYDSVIGNETNFGNPLRPIVTLNSSVEIDRSDASKDGSSAAKAWVLKL